MVLAESSKLLKLQSMDPTSKFDSDDSDVDNSNPFHNDVCQMLEDKTWALINIDAPSWYINNTFRAVFDSRSSYDSIATCSPLELAPNLHQVLTSSHPPNIDFLQSLPKPVGRVWGVYVIVIKKIHCKPKIYIGSGTDAVYGVKHRLKSYENMEHRVLPRFVRQGYQDGYRLAHSGLLCWTPLPSAGLVPRVRARILALESIFTCLFHAKFKMITDEYYEHLLLWKCDTVSWEPSCTHLPIKEKLVGDFKLTEEELEIIAAKQVQRRADRSKRHRETVRNKDIDAYLARDRIMKNAWAAKNRDKVNQTAAKVRGNALSSNRFSCDVCQMSLQSQIALDKHLLTQSHADSVAGIEKPEMSQYSINRKTIRANAKASGEHSCNTCNKSFDTNWALNRHNATPSHKKKLESV